ncbi:chemotaxis protein CheA, partial [Azoarcus indigens]|nr:chemotaxis protein CheA [Azoarcus indigens]
MEAALRTFFEESGELLAAMDAHLRALCEEGHDVERLHALFRAAHTIKGSAGMFGLEAVVGFTHHVENLLSRLRDGALTPTPSLLELLLECRDHLEDLVGRALEDDGGEALLAPHGDALLARLQVALGEAAPPPATAGDGAGQAASAPAPASPPVAAEAMLERVQADTWHLSLRFAPGVLRDGMDPLSFLRYLGELGRIVHVTTLLDALPAAEDFDPLACYFGFEVELDSERDKAAIEAVFDFVRDDCQLRLLPPHSRIADYVQLIHDLPEGPERLGEILVAAGALTARELELGLADQTRLAPQAQVPLGELLVAEGMAHPPVVEAALERQAQAKQRASADKGHESQFVRVHAEKLDELINLVGELVIAGAASHLVARSRRDRRAQEAAAAVNRLVEQVRDVTLKLRMVEIGETFNRFHRVVRELGRELGKDIALEITGADTELDKTMVEKLGDPLMHLVRNAIDHGLEPPEARRAAGKPERGRVSLNAYHDSGGIVIEIGDDGRGLDRERLLAHARERGLVAEHAQLSDAEVHALIFEPGFSTAEQVTNVSGRGVGMDVVKKTIAALRGSIHIDTTPGQGTTLRLRLPLTLAIIDGFLVRVQGVPFVLPLEAVRECIALAPALAAERRQYVNLRGEVLPYVRLRELFALGGEAPRRENIVVIHHQGQRIGVVVDQLQGELQTVIKPLGRLFRGMRGLSGSSILGSGEVALILDVAAMSHIAT